MPAKLILVTMWTAFGALMCVITIPLIRGKVGRNGLYGVRTPKTLASDEVWYPANRYGGRQLMGAGIAIALGSLLLGSISALLSLDLLGLLGLALTMGALGAAVVRTLLYVRTL